MPVIIGSHGWQADVDVALNIGDAPNGLPDGQPRRGGCENCRKQQCSANEPHIRLHDQRSVDGNDTTFRLRPP
jgi:hypothetical protein